MNSLYNFYFTAYEKKLFEALIEKFVVDNEILIHNNNFHWFFCENIEQLPFCLSLPFVQTYYRWLLCW